MQYSIYNYSQIDLGNRIDAEYFQPTYLHIEKELLKHESKPLRNYCSITGSAFYPAATHLYKIGDLSFIRCVDCTPYPIITSRQDNTFEKIPVAFANEYKNIKRLTKGEIVITKVGTPCYASIIHDIEDVALSRTVLGLKSIKHIDPYYLVVFLRSKYGFLQLFRERELTIQFQLTLDRVGNILVFKPQNDKLEKLISHCFLIYEEILKKSIELYAQAKTLLLSELGLTNWQPKHQLTFIKNYSDTEQAKRFDADYFQPKYDEIVTAIKNYSGGWRILEYFIETYSTGFPFKSDSYTDDGCYLIRINNIGKGNLNLGNASKIPIEDMFLSEKDIAKENDILISMSGTIGNACKIPKHTKAVVNQRIFRFTPKKINEEVLTLLINSQIGYSQLIRIGTGGVQTNISGNDIKKIKIPLINPNIQKQIANKITESLELRDKSKQLLENAKRAVEIAIEEDEQTAIKWLNEEMQGLGIAN